ncbi:MAG: PEGA domain-containing protein [Myxococcales bacterium]|nr:PEGA domain-containing protein [Myxococcales bacterium]MCB9581226.1 PEGA domain-containing protein [Polyangiaceae bacterium]
MFKPHAALALVLCTSLATPTLLAQPKKDPPAAKAEEAATPAPLAESLTGDAKSEYEAGRILYQDGDYAGAKLKFERAYDLSKDARLLWNVAAAEKNLRHYSKVIRALERYLAEGGDTISDEDRADAERLIQTVSEFVTKVRFDVNEPGATVTVDADDVGQTPIADPVLVDMGRRTIKATKTGFKDASVKQDLPGGEEVTIKLKLEAIVHEGRVRVLAGVGDTIAIDGKVVGKNTWQGKLDSGVHTLSVTGKGKRPYQGDIIVQDDQLTSTNIALEPIAPPPAAAKDDGIAWPWFVGGAALAAGLGVGAYLLFKPDDETAPPTVPGTLDPGTVQLRFW